MTFAQLNAYLHEPKPQEYHSFAEAALGESGRSRGEEQVDVLSQELLTLHKGAAASLRVLPHPRYSPVGFHRHDFYELMYVYNGSLVHHVDGETISLRESDAILIPPGTGHSIQAAGAEDLAVSIILPTAYFTPAILSAMTRLERFLTCVQNRCPDGKQPAYLLWRGGNNPQLVLYANSFLCEYFDPDRYSSAALDAGLLLFLTALERLYPADTAPKQFNIQADLDRILAYIQQNFDTVTLHELADRFGYSESYLSRSIKARLGISFKEFQHQQCMRQSAFLLASTSHSVRQVAQEVGLSNLTFFYQLFHRYYGVSPAEYRQRLHSDPDGA